MNSLSISPTDSDYSPTSSSPKSTPSASTPLKMSFGFRSVFMRKTKSKQAEKENANRKDDASSSPSSSRALLSPRLLLGFTSRHSNVPPAPAAATT
jgi:hypothetical protein